MIIYDFFFFPIETNVSVKQSNIISYGKFFFFTDCCWMDQKMISGFTQLSDSRPPVTQAL